MKIQLKFEWLYDQILMQLEAAMHYAIVHASICSNRWLKPIRNFHPLSSAFNQLRPTAVGTESCVLNSFFSSQVQPPFQYKKFQPPFQYKNFQPPFWYNNF